MSLIALKINLNLVISGFSWRQPLRNIIFLLKNFLSKNNDLFLILKTSIKYKKKLLNIFFSIRNSDSECPGLSFLYDITYIHFKFIYNHTGRSSPLWEEGRYFQIWPTSQIIRGNFSENTVFALLSLSILIRSESINFLVIFDLLSLRLRLTHNVFLLNEFILLHSI